MGLIDTLSRRLQPVPDERASWPAMHSPVDNFWPYVNATGGPYPIPLRQTLQGTEEQAPGDFGAWAEFARGNAVVNAAMSVRAALFSEANFIWRQRRSGRPGELFGTPALGILERPWPSGNTRDLLAGLLQDADLSGNAFVVRLPDRLVRLRPDWMTVVLSDDARRHDAYVIGYVYHPGGRYGGLDPVPFTPEEVAHFILKPDPVGRFVGVSWLPSVLRELLADGAATSHKLKFFEHGATPNMVISLDPTVGKQAFDEWRASFRSSQEGLANAYKTLILGGGAKAEVVGANMQQIDFKVTQGAGETRIAVAAGVPAVVLGISEGLAGSSLNAGNFAQSMRRFADITMRPLWRNVCNSLATLVVVPGGAELWYDDVDIPALKDDVMDAAEVQAKQAQAIRQYVDAGFEPASVVEAIKAGDLSRLSHTGLYSVQLQPPMPEGPPEPEAEAPEAEVE